MSSLTPEAAFGRLIAALGPYHKDLIILGGWASRLYDFHPSAQPLPFPTLLTLDADVYVRRHQPGHDPKLDARLKAAGFNEDLSGDAVPPVSKYTLPEPTGFYVEFLTGRIGAPFDRKGHPNTTITVEGVTAQQLDHMHVARFQPWQVGPLSDPAFTWPAGVVVNVVNPTSYIAQKVLTMNVRSRDKRGKDILHIHDVLMRFSHRFEELSDIWTEIQKPQHLPGDRSSTVLVRADAAAKLQDHRRQFFEKRNSYHADAASEAKKSGRGVPPTPDEIVMVLQQGFAEIFGDLG